MRINVAERAQLVNWLFKMLRGTIALQDEIIACLSRLTVLRTTLDREDVAKTEDRLHEVFNLYSQITRSKGWHDADDMDELL